MAKVSFNMTLNFLYEVDSSQITSWFRTNIQLYGRREKNPEGNRRCRRWPGFHQFSGIRGSRRVSSQLFGRRRSSGRPSWTRFSRPPMKLFRSAFFDCEKCTTSRRAPHPKPTTKPPHPPTKRSYFGKVFWIVVCKLAKFQLLIYHTLIYLYFTARCPGRWGLEGASYEKVAKSKKS